ncbi:MAG TPA: chemotaxis protein [Halomonas sp.]|nr:chemotaxis protein [Halomonas sp.]
MIDSVSHILPNFHAMTISRYQELVLSDWFWLGMMVIMVIAISSLSYYYAKYRKNVRLVESLIKGQTREELAWKRQEILEKAKLSSVKAGKLWVEFDESLVYSPDKDKLYNTLDADHFFNGKTLAYGLASSRLLAATPTFLTAIGVLGTFIGLTIGLRGLQVNADDVDTLRLGIASMINGAAIAFLTSVWGVGLSLLLNVIEKLVERRALKRINELQHKIDFLYPRMPAEHSLIHIAESSQASKESLQELHERIGDRLQETVSGMSDAMQQAISDSLNNVMAPAIQSLVDNASNQSNEVLEKLVSNFMEGMKTAGSEQTKALGTAAEEVNQAVTSMSTRMDDLFTKLTEQQQRSGEHVETTSRELSGQLDRQRETAMEQQSALAEKFESFMTRMTESMDTQFHQASERDEQRKRAHEESLQRISEDQASAIQRQVSLVEERDQVRAAQFEEQQKAIEERFSGLVEKLVNEQQELMRQVGEASRTANQHLTGISYQYEKLSSALSEVASSAERSSQNMTNSSAQLGTLSANLHKATVLLDERVSAVTESLEKVSTRNSEVLSGISEHARALASMQEAISDAARQLDSAAKFANEGFSELGSRNDEFIRKLRDEFMQLGDSLSEQVENIEKQAEEWLKAYSQEVREQVSERMEAWNTNTLSFADQMKRTVTAISGIVDDLERR